MKKIVAMSTLLFAFHVNANNGSKITRQEYIGQWSSTAMKNMIDHKIPASITLAQGILESGSGNSDLARLANNHFGIKCHDWKGATMYKDDDTKNECFRKYSKAADSYEDHSLFLKRARYANLYTLEISDYKAWAKGLKAAGYATNPKYPELLIELIETLKLNEFDQLVLNSPNQNIDALTKGQNKQTTGAKDAVTSGSSKNNTKKHPQVKNEVNITFGSTRSTVYHDNKVKYAIAKKGDTYYKVAEEFGITLGQLYRYNDVKNGNSTTLKEGDIINLYPKKSKGTVASKSYEKDYTLIEIAQMEGVKVNSLMKLNHLSTPNEVIKKGQKVALR